MFIITSIYLLWRNEFPAEKVQNCQPLLGSKPSDTNAPHAFSIRASKFNLTYTS
jgi:hypothetical protein